MLFIFLSRSRDEEKHLSLSRGMEHQNFGLCAPILYHWAKETCFQVLSRVVRCYHVSSCVILIINVILVTSSLLLISTIIKVNFFFSIHYLCLSVQQLFTYFSFVNINFCENYISKLGSEFLLKENANFLHQSFGRKFPPSHIYTIWSNYICQYLINTVTNRSMTKPR